MTPVRRLFRVSREMVDYLEELLGQGIITTPQLQARILERFGCAPKSNTINWWVLRLGVRRNNSHADYREAFLAYAAAHPGVGPYILARRFNEAHGTDLTGPHARYWLQRAA